MTSRTLATAVALWAGVAIGATSDSIYSASKAGVGLDTRTSAGAVRVLSAEAGILPLAASGTGFATYTDGWSISYSCRGHEGSVASGKAEQAVSWQPVHSGTNVLTLAGDNADTLTARIFVPNGMAVNADGGEIEEAAGGAGASVTVSLGGVCLDTRVAAGAKRTLTADGGILPLAASGAAFARGGTGDWSIGWVRGSDSGDVASGTAEQAVSWQPEYAGENVLTMTAGANTYTATLVVPAEVAVNAESGAVTQPTDGKTVTTTLKLGGIALDTRVAAGATHVLSSIDDVLPVAYSGDAWAGAAGSAAVTVTATSPKGTATGYQQAGEGTFDWVPSDIGDWTISHAAGSATLSSAFRIAVAGAGTAASPYALTASTGYITGLNEGDYVTVAADAMTAVTTKAARNGQTLVPRGDTYLIVSSDTKYTVTWVGGDSTDTTEVTVHGTPVHADSSKTATAQYAYTFTGWSPELAAVVSNTTYTAQFDAAVRSYTVTFVNEDGTTLQEDTLAYGATPAYSGSTPAKAATAQYTYTFKGWDKDVAAVTGAATYTATYTATVNEYTITWKNDDGSALGTTKVAYGATPTHGDPEKAATAQYSYTFAGWTPALAAVTGAAEYKATYTASKVKYTLAFVIDDETTDAQPVEWGTAISFPANPDRGEWYEFLGWEPATIPATMPTENLTFTAQWKKHSKLSYSASKAGVAVDTTVDAGALRLVDSVDDILSITHSGDGWTGASASAKATVTTTAPKGAATPTDYTGDGTVAFTPDSIGTWTLTHAAADGTELSAQFAYKVSGAGTETAPYALTADSGFVAGIVADDYVAIPAAAKDAIAAQAATASLALVPRGSIYLVMAADAKFTITWLNDDGTTADTTEATVNTVPAHEAIGKAATAQYSYTFDAWTPAPEAAISNTAYTATFTPAVRSYTVTFADEDGTTLKEYTLDYGATPAYDGATPEKAATAQYSYTFAGWDKDVAAVTGAATYTATYTETLRSYTVTWKDYDGSTIDTTTVAYGETPVHADASRAATAEYSYTFAGWTPALAEVVGEAEYTATYTPTANSYALTWMLGDGTVYDSAEVAYGAAITAPADPDRGEWYTFLGWDAEIPATMPAAPLTFTAQWKKADALRYSTEKAAVALDTRTAAGKVHEIADASEILPFAASGANFKSATTKGGWSIEAGHLGKVEAVASGNEETTVGWTPTYTGTNTVTLTSTRSADYTLTATFAIAEEAAANTDAGSIGAEPGAVTVTLANVALDTRTAAGALRTVETKDEVLPFALSGDFTAIGSEAAYAVSLQFNGGDASIWTSGTGDALKEWTADAVGTNVFTISMAGAADMVAKFEISAKAAYGDAAGELDGEGGAAVVSVSLANVLLDTRTAAGAARNFSSQAALEAELLPFTYSGCNWTVGGAGTAVVTVDENGTASTFVQATADEGTRTWTPQGAGTYVFSHTAGGVTGTATFVIAEDLVYPVDANGGAGWLYLSKDTSDASEWGYAGEEYAAWSEAVRKAQTGDITDVLISGDSVYITFRVRLTEAADEEGGVVDWADRSVAGGKLKVLRQTSLSGDWEAATNADVTVLTPTDYAADDLTVSVAVPIEAVSGTKAFFKVLVTE